MAKKVCVLCTYNIKHMTLVSLYTSQLEKFSINYDIIYADKYGILEESNASHTYRYELKYDRTWPFYKKLVKFIGFRKYAINLIENNNYDFIIVWNEFSVFLFSDYLVRNYKGRFCINIRDYNYNNLFFVQRRLKKCVDAGCFSTISSDRFRSFLPKGDYLFIHSYNDSLLDGIRPATSKAINRPIRILFIGRLSYPDSKKRAIDAFGNDIRFEFWLVGTGCEEFESYINEKKYKNIKLHGSFPPSETVSWINNADIIFSLNQENELFSDVLLPIKLYYSVGKHIPILTYKSSYTHEYASKYGFDICVEDKDANNWNEIVYHAYCSINQNQLESGCERVKKDIDDSHNRLNALISKFIVQNLG